MRRPFVTRSVGILGAVGLMIGLMSAGLARGPGLDASVYMTVARTIASGGMPYVDAWDHKPPGIHLALAAVSSLPFDHWTRAWLLSLVASVAVVIVVAWVIHRDLRVGTVPFVLAVLGGGILLASGATVGTGAVTETPGALLVASALGLVCRPGVRASRAIVAGVLCALALATTLQLAAGAVAVAVVVWRCGGWRGLAAFTLAGASVAGGVVLWLIAGGAWAGAIEALVVYNRAYLTGASLLRPEILVRAVTVAVLAVPVLAGTVTRLVALGRARTADPLEVGAAIWVVVWLALVVVQGQFFAHYVVAIVPPLMILGAMGLDGALRGQTARGQVALALLIMVAPVAGLVATAPGPTSSAQVETAVAALERHASSGDRVFVWGNEPVVYLESGLDLASRYGFMLPLMTPGYADEARMATVLEEWALHPPDVIVDASFHPSGHSSFPMLQPWPFGGDPVPDALDPLRAFVRDGYVEVERVGDWLVYLPRPSS